MAKGIRVADLAAANRMGKSSTLSLQPQTFDPKP
jgi:hypothetical protein